ncbi:MAG: hypothetical protein K0R24_2058 [Gammaproteobacteria bacterium]|jgi:hypothetical protein|nr:hypothetical protein [Gammaproteobacteria bacterium]
MKDQNVTNIGTENIEELFENGAFTSMMGIIVGQQNVALGLTKLVLEYGAKEKTSKEEVFGIFDDACDLLKEQNGRET